MAQSSSLIERVAGTWQLPQFSLGLLMLSGSLILSIPSPRCIPLSQAIEQLDVAIECYDRALQAISAYGLPGGAVMGPERLEETS